MPFPVEPLPSRLGPHLKGASTDQDDGAPATPEAVVAETVDGTATQMLELRGTIIRLREQLDRIHIGYEEKVQRLESMHRAQRRDLEDTIRHLRDQLQAASQPANGD